MAGEFSHDGGELLKPKDLTMGYLSQHMTLESGKTIWAEMLDVFEHLLGLEKQIRSMEQQMEQAATLSMENMKEYYSSMMSCSKHFSVMAAIHMKQTLKLF